MVGVSSATNGSLAFAGALSGRVNVPAVILFPLNKSLKKLIVIIGVSLGKFSVSDNYFTKIDIFTNFTVE